MKKRTMVPFVKWVGGKRQAMIFIEKHWPKKPFNTYYEPFVGGGSVLFNFAPNKAIINDLNSELINLYKVIKRESSYKRLKEMLLLMEWGHHIDSYTDQNGITKFFSPFYDSIAKIDRNKNDFGRKLSLSNATSEMRAARFIFLNKNSFNGLYRVNGKGHYNTPSKHQPTKTFDEYNILNVSNYLRKSVEIRNKSFEKSLKDIKKGDFVYFDPPYDYDMKDKGFVSYQKEGFGQKNQEKLANLCKELDLMGVKFLLSNHDTKLIRELYKDFNIYKIKVNRNIGGRGASRNPVWEVLVKNYE